jgi:hypothetical protein
LPGDPYPTAMSWPTDIANHREAGWQAHPVTLFVTPGNLGLAS